MSWANKRNDENDHLQIKNQRQRGLWMSPQPGRKKERATTR